MIQSFGEEIRKLRHTKQVPLRIVAGVLDIDQAILSKIERGIRLANRGQVLKLAEYFGVDKNLLLKSWLSDRILYEIKDDELALEAIKLAEERVSYKTRKAPLLEVIKPQLIEVFRTDPRVIRGWVFGSVARQVADWKSDIDVMIEVDETSDFSLFDLAEIQFLGEKATSFAIDIVVEGALKSFAVESVNQDKILIYEK